MATTRQELAVQKLVENRGRSVSGAMLAANYRPATAKNPKNLTQSKGFAQICKRYGLTENLIVRALVSDIKAKPTKRSAELSLGADILGLKKQKTDGPVLVQLNINEDRSRFE